ncbi:hypothetical protein RB195_001267 [Necator americanus]|uniref:Uncharacterized protein n=1 Tax=Necator americanus TaxID=51031 RepID=A0ABR1DDN1_NECAM
MVEDIGATKTVSLFLDHKWEIGVDHAHIREQPRYYAIYSRCRNICAFDCESDRKLTRRDGGGDDSDDVCDDLAD